MLALAFLLFLPSIVFRMNAFPAALFLRKCGPGVTICPLDYV
jgi:hypothetical protein